MRILDSLRAKVLTPVLIKSEMRNIMAGIRRFSIAIIVLGGLAGVIAFGEPVQAETLTAGAESFFSTLKNELIHQQTYRTRDDASQEIFAFIEGFYNRQRLHQSLAYLSLLDLERWISDS